MAGPRETDHPSGLFPAHFRVTVRFTVAQGPVLLTVLRRVLVAQAALNRRTRIDALFQPCVGPAAARVPVVHHRLRACDGDTPTRAAVGFWRRARALTEPAAQVRTESRVWAVRGGPAPLGGRPAREAAGSWPRRAHTGRLTQAVVEVGHVIASADSLLVRWARLLRKRQARSRRRAARSIRAVPDETRFVAVAVAEASGRRRPPIVERLDIGEDDRVGCARGRCDGDDETDEGPTKLPLHRVPLAANRPSPSAVNVKPASSVGRTRQGTKTLLSAPPSSRT